MAKYLLCLFFALAAAGRPQAQERVGAGRFEGEVALGAVLGYSRLPGFDNNAVGICASVEARYNFRQAPFDVGLRAGGSWYSRQAPGVCTPDPFAAGSLMAVADYNLFLTRNLTLFAGIGAGGIACRPAYDVQHGAPNDWSIRFCAMPRLGCECWNRLRITLGYLCTERANRHLSLTFGIAIGGGRR